MIEYQELSEDDLLHIDGGASLATSAGVYAASYGLLALGGPVTITAGAVAHVAGIWLLGDSISKKIK